MAMFQFTKRKMKIWYLVFNQQYQKYNIHSEGSYCRKKNFWHEPNQQKSSMVSGYIIE